MHVLLLGFFACSRPQPANAQLARCAQLSTISTRWGKWLASKTILFRRLNQNNSKEPQNYNLKMSQQGAVKRGNLLHEAIWRWTIYDNKLTFTFNKAKEQLNQMTQTGSVSAERWRVRQTATNSAHSASRVLDCHHCSKNKESPPSSSLLGGWKIGQQTPVNELQCIWAERGQHAQRMGLFHHRRSTELVSIRFGCQCFRSGGSF